MLSYLARYIFDFIRSIQGCTCGVAEMVTEKPGIIRFVKIKMQHAHTCTNCTSTCCVTVWQNSCDLLTIASFFTYSLLTI